MTNTTELFQTMHIAGTAELAADAAWRAAGEKLGAEWNALNEACKVADAARLAYYGALATARAEWAAIPAGDAKDSAEQNAIDTEGCEVDELRWFEVALATYHMNIDCGYFAA